MKKITYFWSILFAFTFVACMSVKAQSANNLVGNWEVETINDTAFKFVSLLEFKQDSTFKQTLQRTNSIKTRNGKWSIEKDNKTIHLFPDSAKAEKMEIVKFEGDKLFLKDDSYELTLKRVESVKIQSANTLLVGNWEVEAVNGKTPQGVLLLEFKQDGTFKQRANTKPREGKWSLDKDNKTIQMFPDGKKPAKMEIVKFEGDKVILKEDSNEFTLKRRK